MAVSVQGIESVECAQNRAYILNDDALFFGTGYKVLQGQEQDCFAPCAKLRFNGKIKLVYFTKGCPSLSAYLATVDASALRKTLGQIVDSVLEIQNNGFLAVRNLVLGLNDVFVDADRGAPKLVYLPVNVAVSGQNDLQACQHLYELCAEAAEAAQRAGSSLEELRHVPGYMSGDLHALREALKQTPRVGLEKEPDHNEPGHAAPAFRKTEAGPRYNLTATGPYRATVLQIGDGQTILGKSPTKANCVISSSAAVSRAHCRLTVDDEGNLSVADLNSVNGTFVNGVRVEPGYEARLSEGCTLRLADVEFRVAKIG